MAAQCFYRMAQGWEPKAPFLIKMSFCDPWVNVSFSTAQTGSDPPVAGRPGDLSELGGFSQITGSASPTRAGERPAAAAALLRADNRTGRSAPGPVGSDSSCGLPHAGADAAWPVRVVVCSLAPSAPG